MSPKIVYIDGLATAKEAAAIMRKENVNVLIVHKRNSEDAFAIVSIYDLIKGVIIADMHSEEVNVFEIMTKPTITVPADMNIRYVARLMIRAGIRRAPVEDNGELIGMITLSSLVLDNLLF